MRFFKAMVFLFKKSTPKSSKFNVSCYLNSNKTNLRKHSQDTWFTRFTLYILLKVGSKYVVAWREISSGFVIPQRPRADAHCIGRGSSFKNSFNSWCLATFSLGRICSITSKNWFEEGEFNSTYTTGVKIQNKSTLQNTFPTFQYMVQKY